MVRKENQAANRGDREAVGEWNSVLANLALFPKFALCAKHW
jgi:hypothetical protein